MVLFWPDGGASLEAATRYERSFGGAESNFSIALARLGHRARWISRAQLDRAMAPVWPPRQALALGS